MDFLNNCDREYIENKYHNTKEDFNPFWRFNYHGGEYDPATGLDDEQMLIGVTRIYDAAPSNQSHAVTKAQAFKFVLENTRIDVNEHDYFVGIYSSNRPLSKSTIRWYEEIMETMPEVKEGMRELTACGAVAMWVDFDHVVPNWESVMDLGFVGLRQRAKQYRQKLEAKGELSAKQKGYFDSIDIEYTAILDLIKRFKEYATTHKSSKTDIMVACFDNLLTGAPKNIFDALQTMYIFFILCEHIDEYQARSLGNGLDATLQRFYDNDLKNGTFTREEIKNFLAYFLLQFSSIGNYWGQPLYLGGTDKCGNTLITDLSYDILEVYDNLDIYNPKIQIKINHNTPDGIIKYALEMIRGGRNSLLFICEPGIIKSLMGCYGVTYDEARECDISGCCEMHVKANESCLGAGYINAAKAVNYVFSDGFDTYVNKQIGLHTGDVTKMERFEEFYAAFLKQWAHLIDRAISIANQHEPYVSDMRPAIMYSATIEHSLERGIDGYTFGVKYPTSSLLCCAFATAVDSILAVKELVFDEKITTLSQLKDALDNDWVGYEKLQIRALNSKHKYGNADPQADCYAAAMSKWYSMYVTGRPNGRGGVYKADMHSALQFINQGKKTAATPDGRKNASEYSKNGSPCTGMDRNGATALIRSCLETVPSMYSVSYNLDVMLHPSAVQGEDGLTAMRALVDTYMRGGGLAIQFNIFNAEMLKDAQKNPEKYKNLQVRVSGWNVLWNNLSKEEQDAYIYRAENISQCC